MPEVTPNDGDDLPVRLQSPHGVANREIDVVTGGHEFVKRPAQVPGIGLIHRHQFQIRTTCRSDEWFGERVRSARHDYL